MKWLGCFEDDQIKQLNALLEELQAAGLGKTGHPRAGVAQFFANQIVLKTWNNPPRIFRTRNGRTVQTHALLFQNAWQPLKRRGKDVKKHDFDDGR